MSTLLPDFGAVSAESLWAAGHLKWTVDGPGLLGAGAAEMDFGTAAPVATAIKAAVDDGLLGYLPPALTSELAAACAAWQRDSYGWDVEAGDVHPVPDVVRALHIAIEHFSRPGSPVIVPVPAYTPFLTLPELLGRRVIQVELTLSAGRYRYDLDALDRAFTAGGHLLLLCNPHNPVGRVMRADELAAISRVVTHHGGRVFADEIHAPLVYSGNRHVPYASVSGAAADHAITATSASKAWNVAGLKCAQVVLSNDADRERWGRLGRLATDGTSTLGAVATVAAYRHGRPWLEAVLTYLDRNRSLLGQLLGEHLPSARYLPPEGTYLAWLDLRGLLPSPVRAANLIAEAAGLSVVDGADCGIPGRGFVRMNFATTDELLSRMVRVLADALTGRSL
ncbi:cystathione beta-lyase [Actinokineospora alba]|uniref:cysteine-S-conjugate beta-lyase n=1 Tax=Actinokineospora alba TaxID=504798 RepID=A0A1H0JXE1_9PSEU|nr:aminotransferase class I/II-fold pyridoxal phosphate-dependent enzyme [Actinokineospora alba]TDP68130.1 cystathionine beta-lyase [Actinokineospora alba]SDH92862.1 cystathione beta-lyase [Actinokineospora alba]SDO48182.1 cystathione beta-lyase [Actinokineospora alba]